ncbi:MAG TPA: thioredoxin-dependent thiol peroxidase [Lentisphaeria bacterium]|nr:thioredoxin-dependent thiol peroxidase [Lentisphaeria bacterium]
MRLEKNTAAPPFCLPDHNGNTVCLKDFLGSKVLVYFYPRANTPGCTTQACSLRDAWKELKQAGVTVIGISPDNVAAQKKFAEKFNLNFALLADEDHAVADAYAVWVEKSLYGRKYFGVLRSSFLVGEDGKIIEAWYKIAPKDTIPKALQALNNVMG